MTLSKHCLISRHHCTLYCVWALYVDCFNELSAYVICCSKILFLKAKDPSIGFSSNSALIQSSPMLLILSFIPQGINLFNHNRHINRARYRHAAATNYYGIHILQCDNNQDWSSHQSTHLLAFILVLFPPADCIMPMICRNGKLQALFLFSPFNKINLARRCSSLPLFRPSCNHKKLNTTSPARF